MLMLAQHRDLCRDFAIKADILLLNGILVTTTKYFQIQFIYIAKFVNN